MKRITAIVLCIVLVCAAFCGCSANETKGENNGDKLKIVTTIFPIYDWVKNIAGAGAQVDMLVDTGVDLHSFQPTVEDIMEIAECDVFIYVGGESDKWVDDALKEKSGQDTVVIKLMDVLKDKIKEEELKEGMEDAEEGEEEEEEEPEYDEHIWLSLKNAVISCEAIRDELSKADGKNSQNYKDNALSYIAGLNTLDGEYRQTAENAKVKTLVFADRFPFRYMVDDYGLDYYAAFLGCSAESEASFETIVFLSGKVDELGLKNIIKIEGSDGSIAQTVRDNTAGRDQKILTLDSLQSVTAQDAASGASYLDTMRKNLTALQTALNN